MDISKTSFLAFITLCGQCLADYPSASYGPPQDHSHGQDHHENPKPYNFGYAVKDWKKGADFSQHESSDGHNVKGAYTVVLPDGRTQVVSYNADWKNGFNADVKYHGEAQHPETYGAPQTFAPNKSPAPSYGPPQGGGGGYTAASYLPPARGSTVSGDFKTYPSIQASIQDVAVTGSWSPTTVSSAGGDGGHGGPTSSNFQGLGQEMDDEHSGYKKK